LIVLYLLLASSISSQAAEQATYVQTPYKEPKVVYDFYFDDPQKINSALYWIRSLITPLSEEPYGYAPEFMDIKVIIHGAEIVTVAKKNYEKYKTAVERMRYYAQLGVEFKVCGLAASDYGYRISDFYEFIQIVPSAIPELAHWQMEGYAVIAPKIMDKIFAIEEIR
ncbi:MAG: DsrE family protein, partial [Thioalkalispiraceae bacterium]